MSISNLERPNDLDLYCGSLTAGSLTNTGDFTVDGNLQVDGSGAFGIAVPAEKLHVHNGSATFTGCRFSNSIATSGLNVGVTSGGTAGINMINAQPINISTNNTERMRVLSTGQVLIGKTSSALAVLDVNGDISATNAFSLQNAETTFNIGSSSSVNTKNLMTIQGTTWSSQPLHRFFRFRSGGAPTGYAGIVYSDFSEANFMQYASSGRIAFTYVGSNANLLDPAQFGTEIMSIRSTNRVGIMNSSPSVELDVRGTIFAGTATPTTTPAGTIIGMRGTASQSVVHIENNNARLDIVARESNPCYVGTTTAHSLSLVTNNATALTADSSQNVNIPNILTYSAKSLYTAVSGTTSTTTRVASDYTPGMTDTFYYNPASGVLHTLTYRISRQMIAKEGS